MLYLINHFPLSGKHLNRWEEYLNYKSSFLLGFYRYIGITLSDYKLTQGTIKIKMENCTNTTKCICEKYRFP